LFACDGWDGYRIDSPSSLEMLRMMSPNRVRGVLAALAGALVLAAPIHAQQVALVRANGADGIGTPRRILSTLVATLASTEALFQGDRDLNDKQRETIEIFESRLRSKLFAIAAPIREANTACLMRWPFDYAQVDNSLDQMLGERSREFRKLAFLLPGKQQQRFTTKLNELLRAERDADEQFAVPAAWTQAPPRNCTGTTVSDLW